MKTAHKTCKLRPHIDEMKNEGARETAKETEAQREGEVAWVEGGRVGLRDSSKSERKPATNPAASNVLRMWSHRIVSQIS